MEYTVKSGNPEKQRIGCVVIPVYSSRKLSASAKIIDKASDGFISNLVRRGEIEGDLGNTLLLHNVENTLCDRVLLVGCGKEKDITVKTFYKANRIMVKTLEASGATEIASYLTEIPVKQKDINWKVQHSIEAIDEALYKFNQFKSDKEETRRPLRKFIFSVHGRGQLMQGEEAVRKGMAISTGIRLAKYLGNLPGNICTPTYLASEAKKLSVHHSEIKTSILEEEDMEKLGMGSLLSVSRGSREPAKLIIMKYEKGKTNQKPIIFVGKGLTFDAGGISIKPAAAMDEMKYDMCGSAAVFGAMQACADLNLEINFYGVIPSSENLPDGNANKPGDIVTSMSGQTIEILNTDAEGRLILADALTYCERFEPAAIMDIATLTGACVVALGSQAHGLLSNHSPLAHEILNAGKTIMDRAWELPLWDEYNDQLKSNFADVANIGGRQAGAITAACFLSRFTKQFRWAHLDIAGTAWTSGSNKGSTGKPVPLLVQFLIDRSEK